MGKAVAVQFFYLTECVMIANKFRYMGYLILSRVYIFTTPCESANQKGNFI